MNQAFSADGFGGQLVLLVVYMGVGSLLTVLAGAAFRRDGNGPSRKSDEREFAGLLRRVRDQAATRLRTVNDSVRAIGVRGDMNQAAWPTNVARPVAIGVAHAPDTIDRVRSDGMTGRMDLRSFLNVVEDECLTSIAGRRRPAAHAAAPGHVARAHGAGWETSTEITKPIGPRP